MKPADVCIAVLVAVIWGLAFVASRIALNEFSPELMTTLRFAIAALPCLLVPRPKVSWGVLVAISFTLFLGQFLAQAFAIAHGVPVGLSSVIVQSQALFTIGFAALLFRERPSAWQTVGIGVATVGLADDLRHRRLRFQRRRLCGADDLAAQLCGRQSAAPARARRADVRPVRVAVPGRSRPAVRADAGQQRTAADLARADAHVADRADLHARSSAASPPASPIGCGAGCCGIIRRRRWCRSRCWCRSSARRRRAWCSAKHLGRCGSPAWSPSSAALPSCCCRSAPQALPKIA